MIRIEGFTRRPYLGALFDATEAISASGGWLVDQKIFSNAMAAVAFEIPENQINELGDRLKDLGIKIKDFPIVTAARDVEIRGSLVLTFVHDDPDVRNSVPAFG